jgi:hypothetical protein
MSLVLIIAAALGAVALAQGGRWVAHAHTARSLLLRMGLTDVEIHALENMSASSPVEELMPALSAHRKLAARVATVQAALELVDQATAGDERSSGAPQSPPRMGLETTGDGD